MSVKMTITKAVIPARRRRSKASTAVVHRCGYVTESAVLATGAEGTAVKTHDHKFDP